jgi:hypothetical protein
MILISCPCCDFTADTEAFLEHAQTPEMVITALKLIPSPLFLPVSRYLRLLKPPQRRIANSRLCRLLEELHERFASAQVRHSGQDWSVPLPTWKAALDAVWEQRQGELKQDRTRAVLLDHSYLYGVAARMASKAAGLAERQMETEAKQRPGAQAGPVTVAAVLNGTAAPTVAPAPTREERAAKAREFKSGVLEKIREQAIAATATESQT